MSDENNNSRVTGALQATTLTIANCTDREKGEIKDGRTFYILKSAKKESIEKVGLALSSVYEDGTSKFKKIYSLGYATNPSEKPFEPPTDIEFGNGIDLYSDWTYIENEDNTITLTKCLKTYGYETLIIPNEIYLKNHTRKKVKSINVSSNTSSLLSTKQSKYVENIIFSEGIEELNNGFYDSTTIKSITLPKTLKTISGACFRGCSALNTINNFPQNITTIDSYMFSGCLVLENIDIPGSIDTVELYGFNNCQALDIPLSLIKRLEKINQYAFSRCYKLNGKDIVLNDNVTSIGSYSFSKVVINTINIPSGVKYIGTYAFLESALKSIILPNGITEIGSNAFESCNLTEVRIPNTVKLMGDNIFKGNSSLEKIIIEGNNLYAYNILKLNYAEIIEYLGDDLENDEVVEEEGDIIGSYKDFTIELNPNGETYKITKCSQAPVNGIVAFPNKIRLGDNTLIVIDTISPTLPTNVFTSPSIVEKIIVAEGIKTLGSYSFYKVSYVTEVVLPNSLESIGNNCFESCIRLRKIDFKGTVETIPSRCFKETMIDNIILPNTVKTIKDYAFYGCENLESVECENVQIIEDKAFYDCKCLYKINLEKVSKIGASSFYNCYPLSKAHLKSIVSIGESAFYYNSLDDVIFSNTLESVGNNAFQGAIFKELYIPLSLKEIGGRFAFDSYNFNTKFYVEEGNTVAYDNLIDRFGEGKIEYIPSDQMPNVALSSSTKDIKDIKETKQTVEDTQEEVENVISDDSIWDYEIIENNDIALIKYLSTEETKKIIIPNKLMVNDTLYTVKEIKGLDTTYGAFNKTVYDNTEVIKVSDGIEIIGHGAFYGFKNLKKITLPKNLKKIDSYAFYNCISLLSINSHELNKLETLGAYSFCNCTSLKRFYVSPLIKVLGINTFYKCTSLETLYLRNVEILNYYSLCDCSALTNIDFSKVKIFSRYCCRGIGTTKADFRSAKYFHQYAFSNSSLKQIDFNVDTVASLISWSFAESKLVNVYIPKYISVVGYLTFIDVSTLKKVYIHRENEKTYKYLSESTGVKSKAQFAEDSSFHPLEDVNIVEKEWVEDFEEEEEKPVEPNPPTEPSEPVEPPKEDEEEGIGSYKDWNYSTSLAWLEDGEVALTKYLGTEPIEELIIPSKLKLSNGKILNVTMVGVNFSSTSSIFANTIVKENLEKIVFNAGTREIIGACFSSAIKLEEVVLPNTLVGIDKKAFSECCKLNKITLPNGLEGIEDMAFHNCSSLTKITIPNTVSYIGANIFDGAINLKKIYVEPTNKAIFDELKGTYGEIVIHQLPSVEEEEEEEIIDDTMLSVNWEYSKDSKGRITLDRYIRTEVKEEINITNTLIMEDGEEEIVKYLGNNINNSIFANSNVRLGVKKVTVTGIERLDNGAFNSCTNLEEVILDGVVEIGEKVFYKCSSLINVELGKDLEMLEDDTFNYCSNLEKIELPKSLYSLGFGVFDNTPKLTIYCLSKNEYVIQMLDMECEDKYILGAMPR